MPTALEVEINTILRENRGTAQSTAEELLRRWQLELLDEDQQTDCAQFLVACGYFKELLEQVQRLIQQGHKIPWAQFAEALGRAGGKPEDHDIAALFEGAEKEGGVEVLVRSHQLDIFSREFGDRRDKARDRVRQALADQKKVLKDKLIFMRNNRLFEQEKAVLEEIRAQFPADEEFENDRQSFELRWAREIVSHSQSSMGSHSRAGLQWKTDQLSDEQLTVRDLIVEHAKELARSNPRLAYDLAVSLHLMDFNREALSVLELTQQSPAADWLRLELMVRGRQFVSALEEATRLELLYVGHADTMFAVIYARARSLHGLGQVAMALELLRSLVRIRPGYKNAQSLLLDWGGGDS